MAYCNNRYTIAQVVSLVTACGRGCARCWRRGTMRLTALDQGLAMEMKRMNGGSLRAAGYDERARKLVVELTAGTFEYTGVPGEVWRR